MNWLEIQDLQMIEYNVKCDKHAHVSLYYPPLYN